MNTYPYVIHGHGRGWWLTVHCAQSQSRDQSPTSIARRSLLPAALAEWRELWPLFTRKIRENCLYPACFMLIAVWVGLGFFS